MEEERKNLDSTKAFNYVLGIAITEANANDDEFDDFINQLMNTPFDELSEVIDAIALEMPEEFRKMSLKEIADMIVNDEL